MSNDARCEPSTSLPHVLLLLPLHALSLILIPDMLLYAAILFGICTSQSIPNLTGRWSQAMSWEYGGPGIYEFTEVQAVEERIGALAAYFVTSLTPLNNMFTQGTLTILSPVQGA